jgi:exodeoxyribonuclease VII small subunit
LSDTTPSYESNLARLRQVVEQLERGSLSLDESLRLFEEGMALSQLCDGQLAAVEERVKVLVSERGAQDLATRKEIDLEPVYMEREP